ncbi:TonB C-terminal domain-containing protein [Variovorax sp. PCZ-1]|uniref:TonB C-terminal domain-containing protein n=1 Tax=Variovorax sp. PCZ-1 TaxID=2835533 RepID=UPI001BD0DCD3|nr:TonB C-terminal domain-containing protein [Variovorax sp. PCZ-1]MBS7807526.1 TonB C-terminal domain-containing protein [Variovorax sp. PCZ-1]
MPSKAERIDFYPPRPQGTGRALSFALLAHLLLMGALTWGVSWKREATVATVEAELWSALPQQAAPKLVDVPQPPPTPKVETPPEPPSVKAPDIAVDKEKLKTAPKVESKPEQKPPPKTEVKPVPKVDKAAEQRQRDEKDKADEAKRRQDQLDRMNAQANATGAPSSQGTAMQSSGPSSGYAGLIKGRVRPNLVFPGNVSGNPMVSVEVRLAPDGTVLGRPRVLKSSGSAAWDEAVVRAFEKTEVLPRDGGKIWSPLVIDWRVND